MHFQRLLLLFVTSSSGKRYLGGTNDNDAHACEPNYITVHNEIIAKILPVNKFRTLKFLSLLPSVNGWFFLDYYVLLCNTCLYRSFHRHGHHWHSSPWLRCEFLAELPARAHFLVINKGAGHFYLSCLRVWTKTAEGYYKNVEEEVIRLHSRVWSNL